MGRLSKAFEIMNRSNFVLPKHTELSNFDEPLPIGFSQTISQPSTVKQMLSWLDIEKGEKVLDLGSGSGWTTALISYLVGPTGKVYAVERIQQLMQFGKGNCEKVGVKNALFFLASERYGLAEKAPFDRILVSASAQKLPNELIDQLKTGGKMVIPVNSDILEITKKLKNEYETIVHPGFVFVPLI